MNLLVPQNSAHFNIAISEISGQGLFIATPLASHTPVLWINEYEIVNALPHHLPQDAVIYVPKSSKTFKLALDRAWSHTRPLWHYMNHSENPNLRLCMHNSKITWVAMRDILAGEELVYYYDKNCIF